MLWKYTRKKTVMLPFDKLTLRKGCFKTNPQVLLILIVYQLLSGTDKGGQSAVLLLNLCSLRSCRPLNKHARNRERDLSSFQMNWWSANFAHEQSWACSCKAGCDQTIQSWKTRFACQLRYCFSAEYQIVPHQLWKKNCFSFNNPPQQNKFNIFGLLARL